MKYLIIGLGNKGMEYKNTRHNIGFDVIDSLAKEKDLEFERVKHSKFAEMQYKGRKLILVKPSTFMNLSGKAVNYWLAKEKMPISKVFVIVDDIALPFGAIRVKSKGSDGGHNGLAHINQTLGHNNYARLRFGIGSEFRRGKQIDHVLGEWSAEESEALPERIDKMKEAIKSFATIGIERTMNSYNGK